MESFVLMLDKIKKVINNKVKNLHPEIEKKIIDEILLLNITSERNILNFIREKLDLPKLGSTTKLYWIKRGWSELEANVKRIKLKMPSSPLLKENWINKINDKTGELYTNEEIKYKINSFRKTNKEYWLERGFTEVESINKISEYQKENSVKFVSKIIENPEKYLDRTNTQLNWYIKNGDSTDVAINKLRLRQDSNSLNSYINKYGEEIGKEKYNLFVAHISYTLSRKYYTDKFGILGDELYDELLVKRSTGIGKASKESMCVIQTLYDYAISLGIQDDDIYFGNFGKNEYFLKDDKNFFRYDFTIKSLKLIVEYNGIIFHPNPNWSEEKRNNWFQCYTKENFTTKYNFDVYKNNIAINMGFEVYNFYSDENVEIFNNKIKEIIRKKYEKNRR